MPSYPTTKDEWWESIEKNWDAIERIILDFYPNQEEFPEDGWPANNTPQGACNQIIQELRDKHPIWKSKDFFKAYINHLKDTKDTTLNNVLQMSWFGMPESGWVRETEGFFQFCDLCSESHVLFEKEVTG